MRAAAGLIIVFLMAGAVGANPAHSDVICGENWITFTATYSTLKTKRMIQETHFSDIRPNSLFGSL